VARPTASGAGSGNHRKVRDVFCNYHKPNKVPSTFFEGKEKERLIRKEMIFRCGIRNKWVKTKMARELGVNRKTIYRMISEFFPEKINRKTD